MDKIDLLGLGKTELTELTATLGAKTYAAKQIFAWLHKSLCADVSGFTNLSKDLRAKLDDMAFIQNAKIEKIMRSDDGNTAKYLLNLDGSTIIESVFLRFGYGNTVCVSTQAGCRMRCAFCVSGQGFMRNLRASEILAQIYAIARDTNERISHVVLMGAGEPLDNYNEVLKFMKLITDADGYGLSARHITLSTCGITPNIYALSKENLPITLALSLHAPNDDIRKKLLPIAKAYPLDGVLEACKAYADTTKRRVTFEYILLDGINAEAKHASELARRLKALNIPIHVNLIPFNSGSGSFRKPAPRVIEGFKQELQKHKIETTIRQSQGADIAAACGQLKAEFNEV